MLRRIGHFGSWGLYEQQPTQRCISIDGKRWFLHWPYVIFAPSSEGGLNVYASNKPLKHHHDFVGILPLPNSYQGGSICLGKVPSFDHKTLISRFWTAEFVEAELAQRLWYSDLAQEWRYSKNPLTLHWPFQRRIGDIFPFLPEFLNSDYTDDRIRDRAYYLWQLAGQPLGQDEHFWQVAEQQIIEEVYQKHVAFPQPKIREYPLCSAS